jgi:hypothetical protein
MVDAQKIADNLWVLVLSRLSMVVTPLLITMVTWTGASWLDGRFNNQGAKIDMAIERVAAVETKMVATTNEVSSISDRVLVLETGTRSGGLERDKAEVAILNRLDQVTQSVGELTASVAALTAIVETMNGRDVIRRRAQPPP